VALGNCSRDSLSLDLEELSVPIRGLWGDATLSQDCPASVEGLTDLGPEPIRRNGLFVDPIEPDRA
jgi:hypothetical protein